MKDRAVIVGCSDKFIIYFTKYLILNNIETYLIIRKNEDSDILKEIEKDVTIIRLDGNVEHLKLFLKSIEPKVIYNLCNIDLSEKPEIKEVIDRDYSEVILILEALTDSRSTKFINFINKILEDENKISLDLYSAIEKSLESIIEYYKNKYNIEVLIKYKTGDMGLDLESLMNY